MIHYVAVHARPIRRKPVLSGCRDSERGRACATVDSIFGNLLKPIDRRQFQAIVDRHDGDAYDKSFKSWDHLVALVCAQLSHVASLRGLELAFNANSHHHYHLNVGKVARSTLSDANARRPVGVFAETFAMLAEKADRRTRSEGAEMVRLIDSSPIPLGKMCKWAKWNGRIRGMKMHVVYHPENDFPRCVEVTPANVNDVEIGRQTALEAGATYVFDKGYYHFGWWKKINDTKAFFVTRAKANTRLRIDQVPLRAQDHQGDGFRIIDDAEVMLASKGDSRLPIPLRRIKVKRDKGGTITLITNDLKRTAVEIAALYKGRWQIELLFRWIKQHLNIRKFLGNNDNAIRLQVFAAMIAYLLLRLARRLNSVKMPDLRFAELVCQRLVHANARSQKSTSRRQSIQASQNPVLIPINWGSGMRDFPRTALPLAGEGRGGVATSACVEYPPPTPKGASLVSTPQGGGGVEVPTPPEFPPMNPSTRLSRFNIASLALGLAFLYLPIVILVIYSFNASRLVTVWGGWSLRWYGEFFNDRAMLEAAWMSFRVAATSATLATLLGTLAAVALSRGERFKGRTLFSGMLYAPLVMPEVITGLSLLLLFVALNAERGFWTVTMAHTTLTMCFVAVVVQLAARPARSQPGRGGDGPRLRSGAGVSGRDAAADPARDCRRLDAGVHAVAGRSGDCKLHHRPRFGDAADPHLFGGAAWREARDQRDLHAGDRIDRRYHRAGFVRLEAVEQERRERCAAVGAALLHPSRRTQSRSSSG